MTKSLRIKNRRIFARNKMEEINLKLCNDKVLADQKSEDFC